MAKKKKTNQKIGKINPILYAVLYRHFKPKFTKKYHATFDKDIVKEIKGPAIVVATHSCDMDHILSGLTMYPVRPTYIVSEHFMRNPSTAKLLKFAHVITKKMFTPDVSTIKNILRAKKENAVIFIFPEGRLSCYGRTLPITDGTAELIKKLGVDLYAWKAEGAYCTFPKWREKGEDREGKIHASIKRLMTADEVEKVWREGYRSNVYYTQSETLKEIINTLNRGFNGVSFSDFSNYLLFDGGVPDPYMCFADFNSYNAVHNNMDKVYEDRAKWLSMSAANIAGAGRFAADRAVKEYADNIWHAEQIKD